MPPSPERVQPEPYFAFIGHKLINPKRGEGLPMRCGNGVKLHGARAAQSAMTIPAIRVLV